MVKHRLPLLSVLHPTPELAASFAKAGGETIHATQKLSSAVMRLASRELQATVDKLLDLDLVDISVSAWKKFRALQKFRDRNQYPPDVTAIVSLLEHTIRSKHRPRIDITVAGAPLPPLFFDFELGLMLEGVTLSVRDGSITEIAPGRGRVQAKLAYKSKELWEQKSGYFEFPGAIRLGDGASIPAAT